MASIRSDTSHIEADNARWRFDGDVPERFEAHIAASVPGYRQGHELVAALSDFFVREGSTVYDLGCSTGAVARAVADAAAGKRVRIIGVEREPAMVQAGLRACADHANIEIVEGDIAAVDLAPCDLIVAYYTLQFVRPAVRQRVFDRIYAALDWGGAFIAFEKVRAPDARFQDLVSTLYVDHKLAAGFDEREIVAKTRSLKGVLEPFSTQGNLDLFARAGFRDVMSVWKHLCFEGFLAIK